MFKFNGGNGAIICDCCRIIMKENISQNDWPEKDPDGVPYADICDECFYPNIGLNNENYNSGI